VKYIPQLSRSSIFLFGLGAANFSQAFFIHNVDDMSNVTEHLAGRGKTWGRDTKTGLMAYRCVRGTNSVEEVHNELRSCIGSNGAGSWLTVAILREIVMRRNVKVS
jgi:hypothetical protein